jgi:hypothetical protein
MNQKTAAMAEVELLLEGARLTDWHDHSVVDCVVVSLDCWATEIPAPVSVLEPIGLQFASLNPVKEEH